MSVFLAVQIKDAGLWLKRYISQIENLDYDPLHIVCMYGVSTDDTYSTLKHWSRISRHKIDIYKEPYLPEDERHGWALARIKREFQQLFDEDYFFLCDPDVVGVPSDTLKMLIADCYDVVAPYVWIEGRREKVFFDCYGFRAQGGNKFSPYHPFGEDSKEPVQVDAVGSCYLATRKAMKEGVYSNPFPHIQFCQSLIAKGFKVYADPSINIVHVDLEKYGIYHFPPNIPLSAAPFMDSRGVLWPAEAIQRMTIEERKKDYEAYIRAWASKDISFANQFNSRRSLVTACYKVLNESEYLSYSLASVYPYVDKIDIVEGAVEKSRAYSTADCSSIDDTVKIIKEYPDPDNKIHLVQGKWKNKEEAQQKLLELCESRWMLYCYDGQTEILTKTGFIRFDELQVGKDVLTLNPGTFELEYQKPSAIHKIPYLGKMFRLKGKLVDLKVSPKHKMFIAKRRANGHYPYQLMAIEDVAKLKGFHLKKNGIWHGKKVENITIRSKSMNISIFMRLLGWYLAEGFAYAQPFKGKTCSRYKIGLAYNPKNNAERDELCDIVRSIGASPIVEEHHIIFYCKPLYSFFKHLGHDHEKHIPRFILNFASEHLSLLLDSYVRGDGHYYKQKHAPDTTVAVTTSKELADNFQEIAIKLGFSANIHETPPRKGGINSRGQQIIGRHNQYWLSLNRCQNEPVMRHVNLKPEEDSDGFVYCVTVPNHVILVRRNGKVVFCGNCDGDEIYSEDSMQAIREFCSKNLDGKVVYGEPDKTFNFWVDWKHYAYSLNKLSPWNQDNAMHPLLVWRDLEGLTFAPWHTYAFDWLGRNVSLSPDYAERRVTLGGVNLFHFGHAKSADSIYRKLSYFKARGTSEVQGEVKDDMWFSGKMPVDFVIGEYSDKYPSVLRNHPLNGKELIKVVSKSPVYQFERLSNGGKV